MKRLISTFAPAILIVAVIGCKNNQNEKPLESANLPLVSTIIVHEQAYTPVLTYTGTAFAYKEANLGATLPGKVERIFFNEGDRVKKGDLIVELSDEMLTQATIEFETIKKDFERVSRLREKGSISEMEYDHIRAKYEASKAKVEMVKKNTQVFAPFSGILTERMMEEGEVYFINPGIEPGYSMRSGIVRLMQLNPVKVKFDINEKDLNTVRKGLAVEVRFDGVAGKVFRGRIDNIKQMLSTTTHSTSAEVTITNPDLAIKPGMFAYIDVMLPGQNAVVLPIKCIYRMPGTSEDYVYTLSGGKVSRVRIEQLRNLGDQVAVRGIPSGTEVIVEGKNRVTIGGKVRKNRQ